MLWAMRVAARYRLCRLLVLALLLPFAPVAAVAGCPGEGLAVQVLGSTGPEILADRAAAGYVLWLQGRPRVLVDAGNGTARNFIRAGGEFARVDLILLTHLHVDHTADLPVYVKASFLGRRDRDLPVLGPTGNARMPGVAAFLQGLFGPGTPWQYLGEYLPGGEGAWHLQPHAFDHRDDAVNDVFNHPALRLQVVPVQHGPIPALAWRVQAPGRSIVFSGDFSGRSGNLEKLAAGADVLVAHNAIPEGAGEVARSLHAEPSRIGAIAAAAGVGRLVLSHRMRRSLGVEEDTRAAIARHYDGPVDFAADLDCY